MGAISDKDISQTSELVKRVFLFTKEAVVASQAGVIFGKRLPGVAYEVVKVLVWARASHANARVDVRVGGTTVLAATVLPGIGAADPISAALTATTANRKGSAAAAIDIRATTGVGETIDDLYVEVIWRPTALSKRR